MCDTDLKILFVLQLFHMYNGNTGNFQFARLLAGKSTRCSFTVVMRGCRSFYSN